MKKLLIEWKHFDKDGVTCKRCSRTGYNLRGAIKQLRKEFSKNIEIRFREIKLPEGRMSESNQILFNGELLENLIPNIKVAKNCCNSCSDLIEDPKGCMCRTVNIGTNVHEEIPVDLIKQAANNALQLKKKGGI